MYDKLNITEKQSSGIVIIYRRLKKRFLYKRGLKKGFI